MNPVHHPLAQQGNTDREWPAAFSDCLAALHSFCDPAVLVDFALDSILAVVDAHAGSFFVWDEYQKELTLKSARGDGHDRMEGARIKLHEGVAGWVAEKGKSLLVEDIRTDRRFSEVKKSSNHYHSYSFLSLPLVAANKLVGLINITEKETREPFTGSDLQRAQSFAHHIAVAYENLKTGNRLREKHSELTQTVTELKHMLKQQESLVSLGKLAAHLAHELANPLDAVRRYINLSLDQVSQDSLAREYLLKAKKGLRRSVQVIRGLLELNGTASKIRVRQVELHSLINETLDLVSQDLSFDHIVIEKDFCEGTVLVEDCGLASVFQNLLQNAHHAMDGSGAIKIVTEKEVGKVIVNVEDSGRGVPEENKRRIFEPFFTTKDNGQGTGMGLTICQEIIQRSGGQISCETKEKQGTRFVISIPCQN
ncbi:MAG: GAF domain-containing sensor histidine kinase [Candidatus Omnitrophica bacterium]|nr:GAF domain-containing sensor histidine kinase [Candidatus Omnitrophota bacterium]